MQWAWFGLAVVLIIVECFTIDLVAVWFAISALVMGIVASIFNELGVWWQIFIFLILAAILLIATRPLVKKILKKSKDSETNLELILGHTGMVTERIENDLSQGSVKINGLVWTARSSDNSVIDQDTLVIVKKIDGNKLIVEKKENKL